MRKVVKQAIDRQLEQLSANSFVPAAVLLSRERYTELLKELAYDASTDTLEPIAEYAGVLVVIAPGDNVIAVVPNAEVHWNNVAEVDDGYQENTKGAFVRFTEL